jgi:inhibitor of cysteine peptidase
MGGYEMSLNKQRTMRPGTALLLLLALLLSGCNSSQEVKLDIGDSGSQVEVKQGQVLVISLESNPTTGYSWDVMKMDETMLAQVGESEFISSQSGDVVGAGGVEILRFETVGVGTTYLELGYRRFWEEDVEPLMLYSLSIVVRE